MFGIKISSSIKLFINFGSLSFDRFGRLGL